MAGQLPSGRPGPQGLSPSVEFPAAMGYAGVTEQQTRRILLMYGVGAHSMVLKVLDRPGGPGDEVEVVGRLFNGVGVEVRDFDQDGQVEVATLDYDFSHAPDRAFAEAPLQPVYYRWAFRSMAPPPPDADAPAWNFDEVGRGETWDPLTDAREEDGSPPPHINAFLKQPSWVIALPHAR